jgi:hypothetical protein
MQIINNDKLDFIKMFKIVLNIKERASYIPRDSILIRFFITVTKHLTKQLNGGKIYWDSQFQRFQSIVAWIHCFSLWQGRNVAEVHDGGTLLTSWQPGSRESQKESRDKIYPSKACP